jgi:hypothetical protein
VKYTVFAASAACALAASPAFAVCRVVEPLDSEQAVVFDPTTAALFVISDDVLVDYRCTGVPPTVRAIDLVPDFSEAFASGERLGPVDLDPPPHPAVCEGGRPAEPVYGRVIHVVVRPTIYAAGGSAGLIMPLPARADVSSAPPELFDVVQSLERSEVHETLEFVEDPNLGFQCVDPHYSSALEVVAGAPLALMGCGDSGGGGLDTPFYRPGLEGFEIDETMNEGGTIRYERIPVSESYEVTVLNASSLAALTTWLDENGFAHNEIDDAAFAAYVKDDGWFMAVKVLPDDMGGDAVALNPLIASFRGESIPIMNRLQYQPGGGLLITDAYVVARSAMVPADGDGEMVYAAPAGFDSMPMLAGFGVGDGWLTRLTLARRTDEVREDTVLEAREMEPTRSVISRRTRVRIAQACCASNGVPNGGGRTFVEERVYLEGEEPSDESYFFRAPPYGGDVCESIDDEGGYVCSVATLAVTSWAPLGVVLGAIVYRSRRRR